MKIRLSELRRIIKEEVARSLKETTIPIPTSPEDVPKELQYIWQRATTAYKQYLRLSLDLREQVKMGYETTQKSKGYLNKLDDIYANSALTGLWHNARSLVSTYTGNADPTFDQILEFMKENQSVGGFTAQQNRDAAFAADYQRSTGRSISGR